MSQNPGRQMIYPITVFQRIKYFPYKYHWKFLSGLQGMVLGFFILLPFMKKLQDLTYTPSNVKNYEKFMENERLEHEAHLRHLEGFYEDRHH